MCGYILIILLYLAYGPALLEYSLSPDGITHLQSITSQGAIAFWKFQTKLGGSKELVAAMVITFIVSSRPKFFYFLAVFGIDKFNVSYFKLAFAAPRPYMINSDIVPITCSTAFGNPSGHASASFLISFVVFLDIFHGKSSNPRLYPKWKYCLGIAIAIYWAATIPYTRFLMGAHSLDQIVFGTH